MDYIFKDGKSHYYADHAQFAEIIRELAGDDAADYVGACYARSGAGADRQSIPERRRRQQGRRRIPAVSVRRRYLRRYCAGSMQTQERSITVLTQEESVCQKPEQRLCAITAVSV